MLHRALARADSTSGSVPVTECVIVRHVTFLMIIAVASVGWCADPTPERDPLNGAWSLTSGVMSGKKVTDEVRKNTRIGLVNKRYRLKISDQIYEGWYTLDKSKTPPTMTLVCTKGPNEGQTMLAIYELDKGTLKVCYDMSGKAFPEKFESKPGTQTFLAIYERLSMRDLPPLHLSSGAAN
jgi:uncharacterized protein (TIGR03067 family)